MNRILGALLVAFTVGLIGCDGEHDHDHDGEHKHTAPHGGTLIELKSHAIFAEVVHDDEAGALRLYVLKNHAEDPLKIEQEAIEIVVKVGGKNIELTLKPPVDETTGGNVGASSEFEVTHDALKAEPTEVTIKSITVAGDTFKDKSAVFEDGHKH